MRGAADRPSDSSGPDPAVRRHDGRRRTAAVAGLALAAAVTATVVGHPAAAAPRTTTSCATERGSTIAATSSVRTYRRGASDDATYYACWIPSGRRSEIAQRTDVGETSTGATLSAIAGRYVAVVQRTSDGETTTTTISLHDARTGRETRRARPVPNEDDAAPTAVATTDGTLAWAGRSADCVGLHVVGARGGRTLGCGPVADLTSVGRRVYWLQDGQPRTAVPSRP